METLFDRIASFIPNEQLATFARAELLLQGVGYTDHELDIEEADLNIEDSNDIIASITYRYLEHLERYLSGLGVWLTPDEPHRLDHVILLADACTTLTDPTVVDVSATLDPEAPDGTERLISVLVHLNDLTVHQLRSLIGYTDGRLLDAYTGLDNVEPFVNEGEEAQRRLKAFIDLSKETPAREFIRQRGRLPLHFKAAAHALYGTLNDLPPKDAAYNWLTLALASELTDAEIEDAVSQAFERYVNPEDHAQYYRSLTALLGQYHDSL